MTAADVLQVLTFLNCVVLQYHRVVFSNTIFAFSLGTCIVAFITFTTINRVFLKILSLFTPIPEKACCLYCCVGAKNCNLLSMLIFLELDDNITKQAVFF